MILKVKQSNKINFKFNVALYKESNVTISKTRLDLD